MEQIYFLAILLVFSTVGLGQVVNIPDPVLKNKLLNEICASFDNQPTPTSDVDTNNDGEIQLSEAIAVKRLAVVGPFTSLVGLDSFTQVTGLLLFNSGVTDFSPISGLSALKQITLYNASATTIDTSQLVNLESFNSENSDWTYLDFSQTKVVTFNVNGCNQLTYLNLKNGYLSTCDLGPDDGCTQWFGMNNLKYVCRDEGELTTDSFGYSPLPWGVINSYCSFTPGGDYNTINGTVTVNCGNENYPMRGAALIANEGGSENVSIFANAQGQYLYYAGIGAVTITPQIGDSPYFDFVPTTFSNNFTTLNNTVTPTFA